MSQSRLVPSGAAPTYDLGGTWELMGANPDTSSEAWRLGRFEAQLPAAVPGHVQHDLWRAGLMPDPLIGLNARSYAELEGRDWWYRKIFVSARAPGGVQELVFEGLDAYADVWVNGRHLGRTDNAHLRYRFDVSDVLTMGTNVLVVRVDDGTREAARRPIEKYLGIGLPDERNGRMWIRKPQYVWEWDWAPRLLTAGIWRPVLLRSYHALAIRDASVAGVTIEGELHRVAVRLDLSWFGAEPGEAEVMVRFSRANKTYPATERVTLSPGENAIEIEVQVEAPELWWPAPYGEPALYEVTAEVASDEGSDAVAFRHGFRTVDIERIASGDRETFTIRVNETPIFCKGAGWQPPEALFGVVAEAKLRDVLQLAADADFNMIRVWGGGVYESELFYDLCDELGILVWQDFMFASCYYPESPAFLETIEVEATQAIERLRKHASVAVWCGNNENQWHHERVNGEVAGVVHHGVVIYNELLPRLCAALDPSRPYWPSSPYGGETPNSDLVGDRHVWDYQFFRPAADRPAFEDYALDESSFVSEFGFLGPSALPTIQRALQTDAPDPVSEAWRFHDNLFEDGYLEETISRHWTREAIPVEDQVALGQLLQAEALAFATTHWRSRKFSTSGVVMWGYLDCWPTATSWSVLDYHARPRAGYYGLKRSFAPLLVALRRAGTAFDVIVVNDLPETCSCTLEVGTVDLATSRVGARTQVIEVAANAAAVIETLAMPAAARQAPAGTIAYARLWRDSSLVGVARGALIDSEFGRLALPEPVLSVERDGRALKLQARTYVFGLHIETDDADARFDDNWFDLVPGETRRIEADRDWRTAAVYAFADARVDPRRRLLRTLN
jgi:beta-mannosidase